MLGNDRLQGADGVAHQQVFCQGKFVGQREAEVAQRRGARQCLMKQAVQGMGRRLHQECFFAPCALITLEEAFGPDILPFRGGRQQIGQGAGVLEAKVDAVSRQRMDAVCGVLKAKPDASIEDALTAAEWIILGPDDEEGDQ